MGETHLHRDADKVYVLRISGDGIGNVRVEEMV